ncbi:MAG: MFS transporter [Candidatus Bathyarchaeia archaeon]
MRRERILFMITLSTLSSLGAGLLGSIYTIFVLNRFPVSTLDIGILLTIFGISSAIFKMVAGKMIDIYGNKVIFLVGVTLGALCSLAYIFAYELTHLYLIEFFLGLSYALQDPARLALIVEVCSRKRKGLIIGLSESAYDIAGSLAAFVAAVIVSVVGFEPVFIMCSGCQIMAGIMVLRLRGNI